jgi:hypothetical protein
VFDKKMVADWLRAIRVTRISRMIFVGVGAYRHVLRVHGLGRGDCVAMALAEWERIARAVQGDYKSRDVSCPDQLASDRARNRVRAPGLERQAFRRARAHRGGVS